MFTITTIGWNNIDINTTICFIDLFVDDCKRWTNTSTSIIFEFIAYFIDKADLEKNSSNTLTQKWRRF